jgi:hypothetical protein
MKMHQPRDSDSRRVTLDRWELRRAGESLEGFDADHRGDVRGLKSHSTRWLSLVSQRPHSAALGGAGSRIPMPSRESTPRLVPKGKPAIRYKRLPRTGTGAEHQQQGSWENSSPDDRIIPGRMNRGSALASPRRTGAC